jgi:cell wall-associated NlpC family hydrolase
MLKRIAVVVVMTTAVSLAGLVPAAPSMASPTGVPDWVKPALRYLVEEDLLDRDAFEPNSPMRRAAFKRLIDEGFGGGYSRTKGQVTAGEVGATLVRVLDRMEIAKKLSEIRSPDGWDPHVPARFGTEVVSRELGLRHDRPTSEESMEAAADDAMRQADIVWAVWKALTAPSLYSADELANFDLDNYDGTRRKVIRFALSLAGAPYVWGGEWLRRTPDGYPFGAQPAGGFDCSGFIWYVLQEKTSSYSPIDRPYRGWSIPQRSSSDMAKATPKNKRLSYKRLKPGDIVLFAPGGKDSKASEVYHAGLYLGKGWIVHSSGSRAGVSLASIAPGSWWNDQILWGRRIIRN